MIIILTTLNTQKHTQSHTLIYHNIPISSCLFCVIKDQFYLSSLQDCYQHSIIHAPSVAPDKAWMIACLWLLKRATWLRTTNRLMQRELLIRTSRASEKFREVRTPSTTGLDRHNYNYFCEFVSGFFGFRATIVCVQCRIARRQTASRFYRFEFIISSKCNAILPFLFPILTHLSLMHALSFDDIYILVNMKFVAIFSLQL